MVKSLIVDHTGGVTVLTIDRAEALNALNAELLTALDHEITAADADAGVRAVVITGAGEKAFSAGADLKEMAGLDAGAALDHLKRGQDVLRRIESTSTPVIAAVNGLALGGGLELALAATFPVLVDTATLGLPEAGLGLIPGYGGTQRLPRAVGERTAAYLMLTGERLNADDAYRLGMTPIAPVQGGRLLSTAVAIADQIAAQGPQAVRSILQALVVGRNAPLEAGLTAETGLAALALAGAESSRGVDAFLQRIPSPFLAREDPDES